MGVRKAEDTKIEAKKKKRVVVICTSLLLNNNQLRSLENMRSILDFVMFNPSRLEWLNLSYNYLQSIDEEILKFENLKSFQFHGNYLNTMSEIEKLGHLPYLQTVTFYGNPIE